MPAAGGLAPPRAVCRYLWMSGRVASVVGRPRTEELSMNDPDRNQKTLAAFAKLEKSAPTRPKEHLKTIKRRIEFLRKTGRGTERKSGRARVLPGRARRPPLGTREAEDRPGGGARRPRLRGRRPTLFRRFG